jgi:hypothetical protein
MTIVMINPMLHLYANVYRYTNSVEAEPLSEETIGIIAEYIDGCSNTISLQELEELCEEEEGDA